MAGRRKKRIWWDDEKRSICLQTAAPGVSVAQVARRYAMNANLIFKWECPEFCVCVPVHGGFKYSHALKRSSNIIANWLRAANHSRTFLPPFSKLRMAR